MGIDKSGEDDFSRAIDLGDFFTILLQPGIAERVFGSANGNDFPAEAQDSAVFDDAELSEVRTAAGSGPAGSRL
jgi:hypothetical protein